MYIFTDEELPFRGNTVIKSLLFFFFFLLLLLLLLSLLLLGGQAIFEWKYMFFLLFSTIKVNLVAEIMQSAYLSTKKLPFLMVLTWFLILGKIQDTAKRGPPLAAPAIIYPSSCREDQRLSTEGKSFKYCNISKTLGGLHPPPPPIPLYHGGDINLHERLRVKTAGKQNWKPMLLKVGLKPRARNG